MAEPDPYPSKSVVRRVESGGKRVLFRNGVPQGVLGCGMVEKHCCPAVVISIQRESDKNQAGRWANLPLGRGIWACAVNTRALPSPSEAA